jgi:hypothetical protein
LTPLGELAAILVKLGLTMDLEVDVRIFGKTRIDFGMFDSPLSELRG